MEQFIERIMKNPKKFIFGILVVLFVFPIIFSNINVVDEGERAVITRLGTVTDVWNPGIHLKMPFIDSQHRYNVRRMLFFKCFRTKF